VPTHRGDCRSGIQSSSTTTPVSAVTAPKLQPRCGARPWCSTSHDPVRAAPAPAAPCSRRRALGRRTTGRAGEGPRARPTGERSQLGRKYAQHPVLSAASGPGRGQSASWPASGPGPATPGAEVQQHRTVARHSANEPDRWSALGGRTRAGSRDRRASAAAARARSAQQPKASDASRKHLLRWHDTREPHPGSVASVSQPEFSPVGSRRILKPNPPTRGRHTGRG